MAAKILVVDDEPNIVKLVGFRLKTKGFEVLEAQDGQSALRRVEEVCPDLIVLDVMMPPPNGYEVCQILKNDPRYQRIPIVLLTARCTEDEKMLREIYGADAYLKKPYNPDELINTVLRLLGTESRP